MKHLIVFIIALMVCLDPVDVKAQPADEYLSRAEFRQQIERIEDSLKETRRDQLNYTIEKNLLKEAYASNIETINIVLAVVLGGFSLIGYLGIRDIGALKKDYQTELQALTNVREKFESDVAKIAEEQRAIESINDEQDKRLKILEIQEKVRSLMEQKAFSRALEYISVGLDLDERNIFFFGTKGICLFRLRQYNDAITVYKHWLELEPEAVIPAANLLELYLIVRQFDMAEELEKKFMPAIVEAFGDGFIYFQRSMKALLSGRGSVKKILDEYEEKYGGEVNINRRWDYSDALFVINNIKESVDEEGRRVLIEFAARLKR